MNAFEQVGAARIAVPGSLDPAAFADWRPGAAVARLAGETMGTTWCVKLAVVDGIDMADIRAAITALLAGLVAEMSHWEPASVLARFNQAAPGSWFTLPPAFAAVMTMALDIAARSAGAFDPAAGRLVDLWGYGATPAQAAPESAEVAAALARSGWSRLTFDAACRRLRQPGGVSLDLSGIAKGFAVDAVADLLGKQGVRHCLVEIGGELAGRGVKPDGEPWWVDLEAPPEADVPPFRIALHQLAVATSGDYVRGAHTIDPRSGQPVPHALSVSVVHERAMTADAWATALTVLHIDDARRLAAAEGLCCRWLVRHGDTVREFVSPALSAMTER